MAFTDELDEVIAEQGAITVDEWVEARDIPAEELFEFSERLMRVVTPVLYCSLASPNPLLAERVMAEINTAFTMGYELAAKRYGKERPE